MSVASLAYLFNTSYSIDGGNLPSTLAGEYSFSLSVDFALVFLGVVIYALRTGRLRWLAPILFTLTILSHVVPALFAAFVADACTRAWGLPDEAAHVNRYGGAIAMGHPLGMSGARIALSAARQLHETGGRHALATLCVGVGQGVALVLHAV